MPTPSLLIVPSRWKTGNPGKLYSQIPTNGNGDFNVTGVVTGAGNIGTRVNDLGYIETITTSGTPRLDYYTSSGTPGCPALLVEPAATNLALQSEDFNTTWNQQNSLTVNSNTAISPDGTQNADTINVAAVSDSRITQVITVANSTTYTISCFYKNIALTAGQTFNMRFNNFLTAPNNLLATATIDLAAGTATYTIGGTAGTGFSGTATGRVENYGNGWYRVSMTFTVGSAGGNAGGFQTAQVGSATARSFYAWGAQLETGSVATSYIPTTAGTVTRAAEVISVSGAVSGSIGQTEGTIYLDLTVLSKGSSSTRWLQIFGASDNIGLAINSSNYIRSIVNTQSDILLAAPLISSGVKVAWAYDATGTTCFINGTQYTLTNGGNQTMSSLTSLTISGSDNSQLANARIRALALYTTRLTNAELMLLTMPGNNTYLPQAVWDNYLSRPGNTEVPDCLYTRHADLLDV